LAQSRGIRTVQCDNHKTYGVKTEGENGKPGKRQQRDDQNAAPKIGKGGRVWERTSRDWSIDTKVTLKKIRNFNIREEPKNEERGKQDRRY